MPASTHKTTYKRVVNITGAYLGPAAERFIDRQIRNHLHKEPENLTTNDLARLTDWIRLAVSLLTDDKSIVEAYIGQLEQLASKE